MPSYTNCAQAKTGAQLRKVYPPAFMPKCKKATASVPKKSWALVSGVFLAVDPGMQNKARQSGSGVQDWGI
jgi:hypothetical protein